VVVVSVLFFPLPLCWPHAGADMTSYQHRPASGAFIGP
jgi:hypothetical protein